MSDITITDADREAAENFRRLISTAMLQYEVDDVVKAFARHRLAAVAEKVAEIERLRESAKKALERTGKGWANAIEFGLIPPQHRPAAQILADDARAAIAALKDTSDGL